MNDFSLLWPTLAGSRSGISVDSLVGVMITPLSQNPMKKEITQEMLSVPTQKQFRLSSLNALSGHLKTGFPVWKRIGWDLSSMAATVVSLTQMAPGDIKSLIAMLGRLE